MRAWWSSRPRRRRLRRPINSCRRGLGWVGTWTKIGRCASGLRSTQRCSCSHDSGSLASARALNAAAHTYRRRFWGPSRSHKNHLPRCVCAKIISRGLCVRFRFFLLVVSIRQRGWQRSLTRHASGGGSGWVTFLAPRDPLRQLAGLFLRHGGGLGVISVSCCFPCCSGEETRETVTPPISPTETERTARRCVARTVSLSSCAPPRAQKKRSLPQISL